MKAKPTTRRCNFKIHDDLAPLLDGMESKNWNTYISKDNVKTITVTFKVLRPGMEVMAK